MRCALLQRFEPSILAMLIAIAAAALLWAPLKLGRAAVGLWFRLGEE